MRPSFDESIYREALTARLFGVPEATLRLGLLIDAANLYRSLLHLTKFEAIRFRPDPDSTKPLKPPEIERLVLVLPESHAVSWMIAVSGYFDITYRNTINAVPRRTGPFRILYSAVMSVADDQPIFKNEQVMLI